MLFPGRWTKQFTRQLAMLLEEGVALFTALELIRLQQRGKTGRRILERIKADLRDGTRVWKALARHPRYFKPHYIETMKWAESKGSTESLIIALRLLADDTGRRSRRPVPEIDPESGSAIWR